MARVIRQSNALLIFAAVLSLAFGAAAARADDGDDNGLLDVSKQVSQMQKKIADLQAHGRWARDGKLTLSAICGSADQGQPFLSWGDQAAYMLAPQGAFEGDTSGWTLNKKAALAATNSPYSTGQHSLTLPKGGEAVSPATCVNEQNPTMRFFASCPGCGNSTLAVTVLYEDLDGHTKKLKVARLRGSDSWCPSAIVPIYMDMLGSASQDGLTAVAFDFKVEGNPGDGTQRQLTGTQRLRNGGGPLTGEAAGLKSIRSPRHVLPAAAGGAHCTRRPGRVRQ
jgi:hypothetical protein